MRRTWIALILAVLLVLGVVGLAIPVSAATTAVITVTNTTQYIAISESPTTYNFNGYDGTYTRGVLANTTYYSNPASEVSAPASTVVDGNCAFDATNNSSVAIDIVANSSNFTSGSDQSTNGTAATDAAGATSYGADTYWSGQALSAKVLCKSSGSSTAYSNLAAAANEHWGLQINEQTNAWTGGTAGSFTITLTASAH
jgi:hypothetical protein